MRNINNEEFDNLGSQIKELRIQMKLTQAEVAEALNVTPGYISNVENNRTAMSLRILMYYAKLMNISLDSLIGRVEPEYRKTALDNELMELTSKLSDKDKSEAADNRGRDYAGIDLFSPAVAYTHYYCLITTEFFYMAHITRRRIRQKQSHKQLRQKLPQAVSPERPVVIAVSFIHLYRHLVSLYRVNITLC